MGFSTCLIQKHGPILIHPKANHKGASIEQMNKGKDASRKSYNVRPCQRESGECKRFPSGT